MHMFFFYNYVDVKLFKCISECPFLLYLPYIHCIKVFSMCWTLSDFVWALLINNNDDNVFPVHAMKAYRGSIGMAPLILNLGTRWGVWFASRSGHFTPGGKKPSWAIAGLEPLKKSKISSPYRDSKPGPSSPCLTRYRHAIPGLVQNSIISQNATSWIVPSYTKGVTYINTAWPTVHYLPTYLRKPCLLGSQPRMRGCWCHIPRQLHSLHQKHPKSLYQAN